MNIAVTCIQLIRDLERYRGRLESAGCTLAVADVPGQHLEGDSLVAALRGCAGVIAGDDRFTADVLERCDGLRAISRWGSGVDGIDLDAAARLGIVVTNTPGVLGDEVADVALAYIVMLARSLHVIDREVHAGSWPKPAGRSLHGATLGIVGLGRIGRAVATRALTAGMTVCGTDPASGSASAAAELGVAMRPFDSLLAQSDFVSVNCPLTSETFHLFDADALARMKQGAFLINTARGEIVSTEALVDALRTGRLAGAALDVIDEEPPTPNHPLLALANVILGSHNASNTLEASARVHEMAIDNLARELGITLPP